MNTCRALTTHSHLVLNFHVCQPTMPSTLHQCSIPSHLRLRAGCLWSSGARQSPPNSPQLTIAPTWLHANPMPLWVFQKSQTCRFLRHPTERRLRSTNPTKKTQAWWHLRSPSTMCPWTMTRKRQLPEDIRVLHNRLCDITVEQGGHCHSFGIDFMLNILVSLLLMLFDLCPLPTLLFSSLPVTFSKPTWN